MGYEKARKSSHYNPQLTPEPKTVQPKPYSQEAVNRQDTENQAMQEYKHEATSLEIQAKYGTITPEGQERLTFLQAKMADYTQRKLDFANRVYQHMFNSSGGDVSVTPPERKTASPIQAKLTIGQPGDKYEQEADRVAAQVVQQIHAPTSQREALPEEDELQMKPDGSIQDEELQMKPIIQLQPSSGEMTAPQDLETSIQQAKGSGQPLADSIKQPMEQAFGADFSSVTIHTDTRSDQLNQSIQARAFTTGQDIFFRQGEYNPGSREGQELLAHELTHVVQQNSSQCSDRNFNSPQQSSALASNGEIGLVQRALELNTSKQLSWDEEGKEMWTGNSSAPSPIAHHINRLVNEGVLNATNVTEFVSGHAIAAAMGGENHENNIVGWDGNTHETKQTEFEWAVLKGQQTTYKDALPPQPAEKGQVTVKAELYGDEKWQAILDQWAMTLKDHVVANWATLKANGKAAINPKIPEKARTTIHDPSEQAILEGIKKSLKAGGHSLERVKRIPNDYRISYASTSKESGRKFELNQENLPAVEFNKSADINTLFQVAKPPKATVIAIDKWFLYSPTP